MTYKIGEPITIKPGDIEPCDTFRATRELMERIVEAENRAIKEEIEANTVVINGRKYGMIKGKPGLLPTIFGMRVETRVNMPDDWDFFIQQRPPMVLTNYDRIISKTPEELAEWIAKVLTYHTKNAANSWADVCDPQCPLYKCCNDQPYDNIEDWLKAPADKEGEG